MKGDAALRREIAIRDAFLARVAEGLDARVGALRGALCQAPVSEGARDALDVTFRL